MKDLTCYLAIQFIVLMAILLMLSTWQDIPDTQVLRSTCVVMLVITIIAASYTHNKSLFIINMATLVVGLTFVAAISTLLFALLNISIVVPVVATALLGIFTVLAINFVR